MFRYLPFLIFLLFSFNGFSGESNPCPETPKETPSTSESEVTPSPGPTASTSSQEPTTAKEQVGLTFDPSRQGGGITDPNLVGVELPKLNDLGPLFGHDLAARYLQFLHHLTKLQEAKKGFERAERFRKGVWERNSGLDHANEQFEKVREKYFDAHKDFKEAEDKLDKAGTDYEKWQRDREQAQRDFGYYSREEMINKRWDAQEKIHRLEKQEPDILRAREEASERVREARGETDKIKREMNEKLDQVDKALGRYHEMEVNYQARQNAPIPKPQN